MRVKSTAASLIAGIFLLVLGLAITTTPARANVVNVGATGPKRTEVSFNENQWLGAEFTLSDATQINAVSMAIGDIGPGFYTVEIVNSLTGGTVEWTSPSVNTASPVFTPVSLTLAAGTYFLIGPTTGSGFGWFESAGVLTQVGGTVGSSFRFSIDHGATWVFNGPNFPPLQFDITGTTVGSGATPEPSSLLLLGTGLLSGAGFLRRKFL